MLARATISANNNNNSSCYAQRLHFLTPDSEQLTVKHEVTFQPKHNTVYTYYHYHFLVDSLAA